jgi:hypothetical protein
MGRREFNRVALNKTQRVEERILSRCLKNETNINQKKREEKELVYGKMEYKKVEGMSRGYDWENRVASGWMAGRDGKKHHFYI